MHAKTLIAETLKDDEEAATISVSERHVELKDQLRDYQYRGEALSFYNLYDFMLNTYEIVLQDDDLMHDNNDTEQRSRGRRRSIRIPYLGEAGKPNKCRLQRVVEHETILRFIGQWFPHQKFGEFHAASILLLLKPWRQLTELRDRGGTFVQCLTSFLATASKKEKDLVENIQYFHVCWDVAQQRRDALRKGEPFKLFDYEQDDPSAGDEENDDRSDTDREEGVTNNNRLANETFVDDDAIERARLNQRDKRDRVFATEAMQLAHAAKIFGDGYSLDVRPRTLLARRASNDDMEIITTWSGVLKDITQTQLTADGHENMNRLHIFAHQADIRPSIQLETDCDDEEVRDRHSSLNLDDRSSRRPILDKLNDDQRKAHDIIENSIFGGK